ncbi:MAG TPA: argininosuccinate synthase [Actinomycetota bacterium]|nr:argininosuccinate synthase [Actinomycetota bacterium]
MMERAVLAYSGGLDTSVTIRWLAEHGYEVHAVAVDVGQQEDFEQIRRRGELAGAATVRVVDAVDRFAAEFLVPAIKANGLYEGKYPMVSSLARPLIAAEVIGAARELGAGVVAHGCTGKGNDQVRFEVSFGVLAPDLRVLAPVRDPGIPREKAIALAGEWGIPISTVATAYSIDENLWGRTAECGPLEDPWVAAPEDAFERTASPEDRPVGPSEVVVAFERGVPVALDGTTRTLPDLIRTVDALGGRYGFGRVDMLENRRVGIKSRELYEVPGALALIAAHRALEDLTLEREVAHHKPGLEQRWSELVYDGLWFSPLRQAIDAYVDATQEHVTGEVRLEFSPGACTVVGRRSEHALYDLSLATYGSEDAFDQRHAEGFVKLWGLPLKVWSTRQGGLEQRGDGPRGEGSRS